MPGFRIRGIPHELTGASGDRRASSQFFSHCGRVHFPLRPNDPPTIGATPRSCSRLSSCPRRRWETSWRTTWRFSRRHGETIWANSAALRTKSSAGKLCSSMAEVLPACSRCSRRRLRNGPQREAANHREIELSQSWRVHTPPVLRSDRRRSPAAPRYVSCPVKRPENRHCRLTMPRP